MSGADTETAYTALMRQEDAAISNVERAKGIRELIAADKRLWKARTAAASFLLACSHINHPIK